MKHVVISVIIRYLFTLLFLLTAFWTKGQFLSADRVRNDFRALLNRPAVDPRPSLDQTTSGSIIIERGIFYSEATEKVPLVIYKPASATQKKLPVVICLHGTGSSKDVESIKELLHRFSALGFMAVAIDARFHGERIKGPATRSSYEKAIINAWQNADKTNQTHPFFFDTVYDIWKLVDYLSGRSDVDAGRIGMIGLSMGGIETWMASAIDTRIKVSVPVISVQSFKWSLENNQWQGRARTIWAAHEQAAKDLGDTSVNKQNVAAFWNKLLPGITEEFDCPSMIRLIAPRPLLILNTENDPNCPLAGAKLAFDAATEEYRLTGSADKLKIDIEPNQEHRFTPKHMEMAIDWFTRWL